MTIDDRIEELEAGFRDLVTGVMAVVKVLREENRVLTGQRDEYRRLFGLVHTPLFAEAARPVATQPQPEPERVRAEAVDDQDIDQVAVPPPREKKTSTRPRTERPCEDCKVPSVRAIGSDFCDDCRFRRASERTRAAWKSGAVGRQEPAELVP